MPSDLFGPDMSIPDPKSTEERDMDTNRFNKMATELQVGDRFFYTGDMANDSSFGTILERLGSVTKGDLRYNAKFDECPDRPVHLIEPMCFLSVPGQRLKTMEQYNFERAEMVARFEASRIKK